MTVCCRPQWASDTDVREADWRKQDLLQQSTRPYVWRERFAAQGMRVEGDMTGSRFELFSMLVEAAIHGLGIALGREVVVRINDRGPQFMIPSSI